MHFDGRRVDELGLGHSGAIVGADASEVGLPAPLVRHLRELDTGVDQFDFDEFPFYPGGDPEGLSPIGVCVLPVRRRGPGWLDRDGAPVYAAGDPRHLCPLAARRWPWRNFARQPRTKEATRCQR